MGYLHTNTLYISEAFLIDVKQFKRLLNGKIDCPDSYKTRVLGEVEDLLRRGVPATKLMDKITHYKKDTVAVYSVTQLVDAEDIPKFYKFPKSNIELIQIPLFYYHRELQETTRPGRDVMNWQTMQMRYEAPDVFFLEIVDSFTLKHLAYYFLKETERLDDEYKIKTFTNQFDVIVKRYGLDLTLFLIDASVITCKENGRPMPSFPMALTDYELLAESLYMSRKLIAKEGGLDRVIPKPNKP